MSRVVQESRHERSLGARSLIASWHAGAHLLCEVSIDIPWYKVFKIYL